MPDQTPREQLAALLVEHAPYRNRRGNLECTCPEPHWISEVGAPNGWAEHAADFLVRGGVRPPARVITTVEERDALPDGTVILDANEEFHRLNPYGMDFGPRTWFPAWLTGNAYAQDFGQVPELPAVVVHTPENGDIQ